MNNIVTMTNNNAMQTSVLIPTVSNVSEQESGSSQKQRHGSFQKNQIVFYKKNGKKSKAIIRSVHFDDELVPYYTIELDGREKQTDSAHLEACSPSIPQEQQQHKDTFYLLPRLDPSPYVVVGSKRRKLNGPTTPSPYVVDGSKRRKLNPRKKTVTFGYLKLRPIENLSSEEKQVIRKELQEMVQKNREEMREEEMKRNPLKRVVWDDNLKKLIPRLSDEVMEQRVLEETRQLPKSILLKHPRQRNTSNRRVVWDDNLQIKLIPRLSEDEDEIVSRNHDTEEEDDFTVDGSSFVNDDVEDDRDDGYGEAIGDVVDVFEELTTIIVNEKKEKKKKSIDLWEKVG